MNIRSKQRMASKFLYLWLALLSFTQLVAQQKTFTAMDAAGINFSLFPGSMQQLQWINGVDAYSWVDDKYLLRSDAARKTSDTILTLTSLNLTLRSNGLDSLRRIPALQWLNATSGYFSVQRNLVQYTLPGPELKVLTVFPLNAANISINAASMNVAYTIENNLFVAIAGEHFQITNEPEGIVCGQSVHRNEFGINGGIFWSADGKKLAFYRMDESMVTTYPLVDVATRIASHKADKYPMAGMTSHEVSIGIYDLERQTTVFLNTGLPADQYLTSVTWHPDGESIYCGLLNRAQNHLKINQYDAVSGGFLKTLFEENDERYVEPLHPLYFLPGNKGFLWVSQRDGYKHLYHYERTGKFVRQLTFGPWVVNDVIGFDPKGEKVFFTSTRESPLEQHTYSVNIKSRKLTRHTLQKGTHRSSLSSSGNFLLDTYSSTTVPRESQLIGVSGKGSRSLYAAANPLKEYAMGQTEIFTLEASDGSSLYCRMIKPAAFDPQKKYPVIVYVYGGPHAQMITESWLAGAGFYLNYLTMKGYIVFTLDNRGSDKRGKQFEQSIHRQLGKLEREDQMAGIKYLQSLPFVDADRIGVDGWSYGGFMAISLKLNHPEVFKVATAGGPVTDWKYYEVMYGERYMGTPENNPDGYHNSSLLNQVGQLEGKLLIIHGDMDNVVVMQHSLAFIRKCIDAGKQVDFFVYPGHEHNVRGRDRAHLIQKITTYFDENL
jgi:dipeptidyl-peptidase-4